LIVMHYPCHTWGSGSYRFAIAKQEVLVYCVVKKGTFRDPQMIHTKALFAINGYPFIKTARQ